MIVKITFSDLDDKESTMLFGNSYKNWFTQFEEYLYRTIKWWNAKEILSCDIYEIIDVQKTSDKWIGYGGLKWCCELDFQAELNSEAKGLKWVEARQYKDMNFSFDKDKFYKTKNCLKGRLRYLGSSSSLEIRKELAEKKHPVCHGFVKCQH